MIVLDNDSIKLADLSAFAAADTAILASLESLSSLVAVLALYNDFVLSGCDADDVLRTSCCASSASGAEFTGYYGYSVTDLDSSEVAGSGAVAESETAILAGAHSAIERSCSLAGNRSLILRKSLGSRSISVALYNSYHRLCRTGFYSENGCQLSCYISSAYGAFVGADSLRVSCQRVSIVTAACESAAATVCSGKSFTKLDYCFIYRYEEYL